MFPSARMHGPSRRETLRCRGSRVKTTVRRADPGGSPDSRGMSELTSDQQDTVRRAAYGAIALVSHADPGFFAMFSESMAGSKALAAAPAPVREMLGGMTMPPTGSKEQVEDAILADLTESMQILGDDPAARDGFRDVVLQACTAVANASDGVAPAEEAMIQRVRAAVSGAAASSVSGEARDIPPVSPTA